ncbi:MAG TPA: hypothetical protein VIG25_18580 [Pyrinomonadaceae bacterium]|jgi:hypothetical protein
MRTTTHKPAAFSSTREKTATVHETIRTTPQQPSNSTSIAKIVLGITLLLLMIVSGCSKAGTNRSEEPSASGGSARPASSPQATTATNTPAPANAAPAVVIATADGERAGTRVEITELKRLSDNTVNLKFSIVNNGPDRFSFSYDYGDPDQGAKDYSTIGGVTLVDGANKKKYFVVRDSENNCVCSRGLKEIPPSSRGNVWAKFPAPPEDVQKISIVIPHFGPIDDAPISR